MQSVAYSLRGGALIREATLRPDATNGTPVSQRVLLEDVARIELGFERGDQRSDFWLGDAIVGRSVLPDLIEIQLTFENGTSLVLAGLTGGRT